MRKVLFSEYVLLVHTVMTYLLSSSLSLVWYLNLFSIFTVAVIYFELYLRLGWRPGREWMPLFLPLFAVAVMAFVAAFFDPPTKLFAFKIAYAYVLAFMYFSVVLATGRLWFLTSGLFISLLYLFIGQGLGAASLALEEGKRAKLAVGGAGSADSLNVNVYSLICLFCMAFALFYMFEAKRLYQGVIRRNLARGISLLVIFITAHQIVIVTGSRKGMIFLCFWLCVAGLMSMRGRITFGRVIAAGIIAIGLFIFGLVALYFSPFFWRFQEMYFALTGQYSGEMSFITRAEYMQVGVDLWLNNPIYGDFWRSWKTFGTYSHSNPIELLVNHGILGFCLYYSYYVIFFKKLFSPCFRSPNPVVRSHSIFIGSFFVMFFLWEIAAVNYFSRYSFPVVGVLLGFAVYDLRVTKSTAKTLN